MGTATQVAQSMSQWLAENRSQHTVTLNTDFSAGQIEPDDVLLICTSNTGVGDLPSNIVPFWVHLTTDYPRIAGKPFGIVNLGDSHYPSFGQAGRTIEAALTDLGAVMCHPPLVIDASEGSVSTFELHTWLKEWEAKL